MSASLLTLKNIACARGGLLLFEALDLQLRAGECVEIRGPNGSGKSTLLRVVAGLFPDYEGSVDAARVLYLGHRPAVGALLSPRENLQWYERMASAGSAGVRHEPRPTVAAVLLRLGLATCGDVPCGRLSQGQQRRVGLARALICNEPLWLLDEPLTALDDQGRTLVGDLVGEHCAAGGAVLCATHQSLAAVNVKVVNLGYAGPSISAG